ncbi:outer membrane usher protein [Dyella sp. OK004]|nr:outer membrane usher protein [Dyella sp. OK004]
MSGVCRQLTLAACISMGLGASLFGTDIHASAVDTAAGSAEILFDTKLLANRGYSEEVARFFSREARFLPGQKQVTVTVNAGRGQLREVRFDGEGQVCFERALLHQLGMRVPETPEGDACLDSKEVFPAMRVDLKPGIARVNLIVPEDAFDPAARESAYRRGGRAALLNYSVFARRLQGGGSGGDYFQAQLESGLNVDNWAFRSQGTYTRAKFSAGYQHQAAYVQRGIESMQSLLQAGQINAASDGFGGMPIIGAQIYSDNAQIGTGALAVPIQGIAETQAVIELRQRGQVIYRTVVAPGPFSLSDIGAVAGHADIDVVVMEEDGRTTRFSVPAPMSAATVSAPPIYHLGVGRYRLGAYDASAITAAPWLVYGDYAFNVRPNLRLIQSALLAKRYQGLSAQASLSTESSAWVGANLRVSRSAPKGVGYEWQVQGSTSLGGNVSAGLSWQSRTRKFSVLEDTIYRYDGEGYVAPFLQSLSASLGWSSMMWGSFGYSVSHTRDVTGSYITHSLNAGRKLGRAHVNLSLQKGVQSYKAAYLSVTMPLGRDRLSTRLYHRNTGAHRVAANYQGKLSSDVGYQLDASGTGNERSLSASVAAQAAYAQWSGGVSQSSQGSRSMYGSATGSMVVTDDRTVAMGAGKVSDTFAVVKVPDLSGLRLTGSGSGVRTSAWGTALVPTIYPYHPSRIQVDGKSLPLNYRLETTAIELNLARGSVMTQTIGATEIRQLMLQVRMPNGSFARVGSSVLNSDGDFMGTVIGEGNLILTNADIGKPVYLESSGAPRCQVSYETPERFDPESPYEEAPATCS